MQSQTELYVLPEYCFAGLVIQAMSIDSLFRLSRCWPTRHTKREVAGRNHFTYYYEGRIVRELLHRKPINKEEQLKVDYCVTNYHNEFDNLSFVFSLRLMTELAEVGREKIIYLPKWVNAQLESSVKRTMHPQHCNESELAMLT